MPPLRLVAASVVSCLASESVTLGYRVDALFGALDTDQRVSPEFADYGFPAIRDRHDDVVTRGPFARLTFRQ